MACAPRSGAWRSSTVRCRRIACSGPAFRRPSFVSTRAPRRQWPPGTASTPIITTDTTRTITTTIDHAHDHDHGDSAANHHHGPHHSLKAIAGFIERSALTREGKDRAIHLFHRLGEAEAAIHGMPIEKVHLHEVGALDSIIDIVGVVYGMEWLGADRVVASPLNVGSGTVVCAHGTFPVPAPATARLLEGVPVYAGAIAKELVTLTGALIVTDYATSFDWLPLMRVKSIGYGAGDRDFAGHPNVLRILAGEEGTPAGRLCTSSSSKARLTT